MKARSEGDTTPHVYQLDTPRVEKEWRALLGPLTCLCTEIASLPTGRAHPDSNSKAS